MPAKAGIQYSAASAPRNSEALGYWIPAFAGMTLNIWRRSYKPNFIVL
jgi:hypothetical protein